MDGPTTISIGHKGTTVWSQQGRYLVSQWALDARHELVQVLKIWRRRRRILFLKKIRLIFTIDKKYLQVHFHVKWQDVGLQNFDPLKRQLTVKFQPDPHPPYWKAAIWPYFFATLLLHLISVGDLLQMLKRPKRWVFSAFSTFCLESTMLTDRTEDLPRRGQKGAEAYHVREREESSHPQRQRWYRIATAYGVYSSFAVFSKNNQMSNALMNMSEWTKLNHNWHFWNTWKVMTFGLGPFQSDSS